MEVFEAIEKRGSYRDSFLDKPIPREDLVKIVQAGICAPSGCNAQTTLFAIVDDPDLLREMGRIVPNRSMVNPAAIIAVISEEKDVYHGLSFFKEDYSAAVENMLLAITSLGYATVWIDGALRRDGIAEAAGELLGITDPRRIRVVLPLGVPEKEVVQKPKEPFEKRAWFNHFGT